MNEIERDKLISSACNELDKFKDYIDSNRIDIFKRIINSDEENNTSLKDSWSNTQFDRSLDTIKNKILKSISDDILKSVRARKVSDPLLIGGCYSIATKLCINYFFKHEKVDNINNLPSWFLSDCNYLKLRFLDFVNFVGDEYKKHYMRYRLWDDKSLKALQDYLFRAYKDFDEFEYPAIQEYCDSTDGILTKEEFIAVLEEILHEYPLNNCCEIRFPPYNDDGYIFAEFVPVMDMPSRYIDALYEKYLSVYS